MPDDLRIKVFYGATAISDYLAFAEGVEVLNVNVILPTYVILQYVERT